MKSISRMKNMLIDITLKITPQMLKNARQKQNTALDGHLGTHFDVMNKDFPLAYTHRNGIIFNVSNITGRDICSGDIDLSKVEKDMFVAFYTGFIEDVGYGNKGYFSEHPQLSDELIDTLLEKGISIIGVDFAGIRRSAEHTPKDQYCADHGAFVIENLCNLQSLISHSGNFIAHTYPMNFEGLTGLPCRVIAEIE